MFTKDILAIDAPAVAASVADAIRQQVMGTLRRRGAVVGLSGGIDSSVVAALCVKALGKERVLGVFMPERSYANRAYFLIDENGILQWSHVEENPSHRRENKELLAAIDAVGG